MGQIRMVVPRNSRRCWRKRAIPETGGERIGVEAVQVQGKCVDSRAVYLVETTVEVWAEGVGRRGE